MPDAAAAPPPGVAPWGLLSAGLAPVLLIGGWTAAAARQREGFDPVVETISALAAYGADDRWLMTGALTGLGLCHVTTAAALRGASSPGRWVLGAGGAATVLVAVFPLPADDSGSVAHMVVAGAAFLALAVWPAAAWVRGGPGPLRPAASLTAAALLTGLVSWFGAEVVADSGRVGLSERVAAGAQALWPLAVVGGVLLAARRRAR